MIRHWRVAVSSTDALSVARSFAANPPGSVMTLYGNTSARIAVGTSGSKRALRKHTRSSLTAAIAHHQLGAARILFHWSLLMSIT